MVNTQHTTELVYLEIVMRCHSVFTLKVHHTTQCTLAEHIVSSDSMRKKNWEIFIYRSTSVFCFSSHQSLTAQWTLLRTTVILLISHVFGKQFSAKRVKMTINDEKWKWDCTENWIGCCVSLRFFCFIRMRKKCGCVPLLFEKWKKTNHFGDIFFIFFFC